MIAFAIIETILLAVTGILLSISCAGSIEKAKTDGNTAVAVVILTVAVLTNVLAISLIWKLI